MEKESFSDLCKGWTKIGPAKSNQLYPSLSNNSGAQWETHCLSEKAKTGPLKVYQSGLRLLRGTGDFKGQIPVPMHIRRQDKVTTVTAAGPYCLFRWDGSENRQYLSKQRTGEGSQGPGEGEKERDKASREALWQTLSPWRTRHEANI